MNQFEHKDSRAEIYKEIMNEPDKEKRQAILAEKKTDPEFAINEELHKQEIKNTKKDIKESLIETNNYKEYFVSFFTKKYVDGAIDGFNWLIEEKEIKSFNLLKERLKDSILIDLGCGYPRSTCRAYEFATVFNVKKYIGVEKYPIDLDRNKNITKDDYNSDIEYVKNIENGPIKKILEKNPEQKLPNYEFALNIDMLEFLSKRTERSNFMMNGVGTEILSPYDSNSSPNEKQEYLEKIQKNIARLVPKGGLVFGVSGMYLYLLKELGFKERKDLESDREEQIWEKIE